MIIPGILLMIAGMAAGSAKGKNRDSIGYFKTL
jgi:hypothetical protein